MPTTTDANKEATTEQSGLGLASRQKYWSEITADEKIERLRDLCKSVVRQNDSLRRELAKIKRHTHDESGKAVTVKPLSEDYDEYGSSQLVGMKSMNPDEVYI